MARSFLCLAILLVSFWPGDASAQGDEAAKPLLEITSVSVSPQDPTAQTLCSLSVEIENRHQQIASQLEFHVEINGIELPVYSNQVFMYPIAPEAKTEVKLYNFWSTETSRPFPDSGRLEIEVSLVAAQWMKIDEEEGVEVWEPLGAVEGLPVGSSTSLKVTK
ncbi:MAG: hypothetical protein P8Y44_01090 [Acidobacteriota bacterium]